MYGIIEAVLLFIAIVLLVAYSFTKIGVLALIAAICLIIGTVMIFVECIDGY